MCNDKTTVFFLTFFDCGRFKGSFIGYDEILKCEHRKLPEFIFYKGDDLVYGIVREKTPGFFKDPEDGRSLYFGFGRQALVAGAHGKTILLPEDGASDDLDIEMVFLDHFPDDLQLLKILFPKIGTVGLYNFK